MLCLIAYNLAYAAQSEPVIRFAGLALNDLTWIAGGLALVSLLMSLIALSRSRRESVKSPLTAVTPAAVVSQAPAASVQDPALIAVITAAVAMMLAEPATAGQKPGPSGDAVSAVPSPAGFTIRQVRRV